MPDTRRHRGQHPSDARLFVPVVHDTLRRAVGEYAWLLTHGYAPDSALKLVGDRHNLAARQRLAVRRSTCSDQALQNRLRRRTTLHDALTHGQGPPRSIGIDGYNLLITIESALSGGIIFVGRDSCYRDLASVHGTYRKVEETIPAVLLIAGYLASRAVPRVDWYLDRPVSNSGRLKALMAKTLAGRSLATAQTDWNIELVDSPDAVLASYAGPGETGPRLPGSVNAGAGFPQAIATCDSAILDRCGPWVNLAAEIIDTHLPDTRKVDLRV